MLLHALFNQYKHIPAQITYPTTTKSSSNNSSFSHHHNNQDDTEKNLVKNQYMFSRYHTDFIEIEKLASGGFGSVYKVI